jgi:hypothetical protein
MWSPRRALLLPAAVAAVARAGCDIGDDGPRTTQTRDVADFTRIDNRDSVDGGPTSASRSACGCAPARR